MLRSDKIISGRNYLIARMIKISSSGLRRREIRRRAAKRPYCPSEEIFVSSVTIYEVASMLILLLIGMAISLIVFGVEKFVFYVMHPKRTASRPILRKKNKMLLTDKEPSYFKNHNVINSLPKASTLFRRVAVTKRLLSAKASVD